VLASAGVLLSAGVTAVGMYYVAHWGWLSSLVFGVLIAATDPVSVVATFREAKAQGRLLLLVEAESLFNDGTAAVFFGAAVTWSLGHKPHRCRDDRHNSRDGGRRLLCGAAVAGAMLLLAGRAEDHLVEITFTTWPPMARSFWRSIFTCPAWLATLTAGLMMGNLGPLGAISVRGREAVQAFWDYAAFVANSLVFF